MLRRKLVRIALVAMAMAALQISSAHAAGPFFSGTSGSGSSCTQAQPCTLIQAIAIAGDGTELACADGSDSDAVDPITKSITIDCSGTAGSVFHLVVNGSGITVTLKNLTMWGSPLAVNLISGTVILDNVHLFHNGGNPAIYATPSSPSILVVRNSIIDDNSSAGVLLKPQSGGSLSAVFDHVTISSNAGGGIKIDTTNGPATADITDSVISNNAGNGVNAVGGAGGPAIFNINHSVIAKNGTAGVQVNGATAAAMLDTTLLDSNASGATAVVNGGHMLTYGNNRIVGPAGSSFTGPAPLQ
jgi:hypothetical protein